MMDLKKIRDDLIEKINNKKVDRDFIILILERLKQIPNIRKDIKMM